VVICNPGVLTIFALAQRKAWQSMVSLMVLRAMKAKTLSWVLSAVQNEILKQTRKACMNGGLGYCGSSKVSKII
jgi:hypothetical protein